MGAGSYIEAVELHSMLDDNIGEHDLLPGTNDRRKSPKVNPFSNSGNYEH